MDYELIITEKPSAAKKIADALDNGKPVKEGKGGVPYYRVTHGNKDIIVCSAVGHLYSVGEKTKGKWTYPVFDIAWQPAGKAKKKADFSTKYLSTIKKLAKDAKEFTVATDYDIEGEVIGLNIIRFACKQKDANRMKFSTLTKPDIVKAYESKSKTIDWGQANAGETRHFLDWMYGINLSRALSLSIKHAVNRHQILSAGRVQGPALKIIVDREKEIQAFKPVPFWQLELNGAVKTGKLDAWHEEDKFWEKPKAKKALDKVKGKNGKIADIHKREFKQEPPHPFDLTTLQTEAYRTLKIQPKDTLSIAQTLYTEGFISYPRTSSQKLPKEIEYEKILKSLSRQDQFSKECAFLLKRELKPNEGKKSDPAHPAIYPTGITPQIGGREAKIYELITRRFLATFGDPAVRETMKITIDVEGENFIAKGTRTKEPGWHELYGRFAMMKEEELPAVEKDEKVSVKKIQMHDKETQPPKRYTPSSIIKDLEKHGLGTKCLTGDTIVKIKQGGKICHKPISDIFEDCRKIRSPEKDTELALNDNMKCFCFQDFEEKESFFPLCSRRKVKKNEAVYNLQFEDGSSFKATEDHPILVMFLEPIYIPVKELRKGMQIISTFKQIPKPKTRLIGWDEFLKKINTKSALYGITSEIKQRREKTKISQLKLAAKHKLNQSRICTYEKNGKAPLYVFKRLKLDKPLFLTGESELKINNPFPLYMSCSLARILGNLVGDGSIDKVKIQKENCYDFRYHNTNIELINQFIQDMHNVFGVVLEIKQAKEVKGHLPTYYVRIPAVIGRIIGIVFREVIQKNAYKKLPAIFYPEFIAALFDDEGHATKRETKLFISNTNFRLLNDLKDMLKYLGIESVIDKKQYKLYIRGRMNMQLFLKEIPFISSAKRQRLISNLSTKYQFGAGSSVVVRERKVLSTLTTCPLEKKEIAKNAGITVSNASTALRNLRKQGYVRQQTVGISARPRKKIVYKLLVKPEDTFYKFIGEKVINTDFITKTIKSTKKITYSGYVYDLTNNLAPNFILANGTVVHNSTRAQIVDNLFQRGYLNGTSIEATQLGIKTVETLSKYSPAILDEKLTRNFELEMEKIRAGSKTEGKVLEEAKKVLTKLLADFKKKEIQIGTELAAAKEETQRELTTVGPCPKCKEGTLLIKRGKFGHFIACDKYPDCKTTFSLPSNARIKIMEKTCEACGYPILGVLKKKGIQEVCINPECPTKEIEDKALRKEAAAVESGSVERKCPKCDKGHLVLRKSLYGSFFGCSNYPKCKFTESIEDEKKDADKKKDDKKDTDKKKKA